MQNADAQRLKMLSLIRQSMFQEALDFNFPNLVFEKAYCFYRLNQLELASSTISTLTSRKALLLKAQIYYRQERFYDAALLYADILNSTMKSESCYSEIAANLNASIANATLAGFVLPESLTCVESSTYELSFNLACIRLAQNRIKEAGSILQNCQIQGFEELKNQGHTEKEIEREMALVMTQIGYQHQLCGDLVKAKSCYEQVMKFRYVYSNKARLIWQCPQ